MQQEERLKIIMQLLHERTRLTTREIAEHFAISFDTARRDVIKLTATGQAMRIHGGLMAINQQDVPDFLARSQIQSPLKKKMAQVAKRFIHQGDLAYIGPSTTLQLLCQLLNGEDLTVVTNSIDNALALLASPLPKVNLLAGDLAKDNRWTYSAAALASLKLMRPNIALVGTSLVRQDGICLPNSKDAELIRTATTRARKVVVIAEKFKFINENNSPFLATSLDKIDVLITDVSLPDEYRTWFNPRTQIISGSRKE